MRIGALVNSVISPLGLEVKRKPQKGASAAANWLSQSQSSILHAAPLNPLRNYFEQHRTGPGIWKWEHYFDIYHRHLSPFRNRPVHILEIGVYSGGSLSMWTDYFGSNSTVHGVDIQSSCKVYELNQVRISIGDQGDRAFWRRFKKTAPLIDVVVDDGSHGLGDQIVSFEELFPHLRAGGVYICEDIHGPNNFFAYAHKLTDILNGFDGLAIDHSNPDRWQFLKTNDIQKYVEHIAFYPFLVVFTKRVDPIQELVAPKHGTEWQPFFW